MDLPSNANRRVLAGRARDWLALAGLAALVLALRLPTLFMSEINMDDSVFMIYGRTLMRGGIPYVDFWDHHPLGGMVLFGLAGRIFGYSYLTLRWFTIGAVILGSFIIYLTGSTLGRRSRAIGLVAALIFAVYSLNNLGLAADRIFFHVPLVGLAFYWFLSRTPLLDRGRMSAPKLLAIGLLLGLSMQIKALYAADYVPLALLIALETRQEHGGNWRRAVGEIARAWALLAGPAVLLLLVNVAYFAYQGRLDVFVYANLTAPSIYAGATPTSLGRIISKFAWQITSNPLAWMGLLVAPLYLILARDADRVERRSFAILGFWFIFPLIAVLAARRLDGHHFLQLLAPLSLFTGLLVAGLLRLARQPIDGRQILAVLLILLSTLTPLAYGKGAETAKILASHFIKGRPWPQDANVTVADYLRGVIRPGESLFVVDYNPVIYTMVDAPIPTPYILPVFLIDQWYEAVANIDQVQVLDETMARKPTYVVLQARPNREFTNQRVAQRLTERLTASYTLEQTVPGVETYTLLPVDVLIYRLRD
jgi:hypothetical protein